MLAYGILADLVDDHLAMGESRAIKCVKRFAIEIVNVLGEEYLRAPNAQDTARLLEFNKSQGFPVCLVQLIACTGLGKTVLLHVMDRSKDTIRMSP
jgi:hypothetical protein